MELFIVRQRHEQGMNELKGHMEKVEQQYPG